MKMPLYELKKYGKYGIAGKVFSESDFQSIPLKDRHLFKKLFMDKVVLNEHDFADLLAGKIVKKQDCQIFLSPIEFKKMVQILMNTDRDENNQIKPNLWE